MPAAFHDPVLCDEALAFLVTDGTKVYVDATVGGGGHAESICRALTGEGRLICVDADSEAIEAAQKRLEVFQSRLTFVRANFVDVRNILLAHGIMHVQGLLLDLGVSSHQLDEPGRGFSFRADEKLDMRMNRQQRFSAWDVANTYDERALADVLWSKGEEHNSRRIARRIVQGRPVDTTSTLRRIVESAVGARYLTKSLARVFQAIRIEVNGELKNLQKVLQESLDVLSPYGRIVVISYHSLEDRIVKEFFRREAARRRPPGMDPRVAGDIPPKLKLLTKKPVIPGAPEVERNPRARSAKLRAAERCPE